MSQTIVPHTLPLKNVHVPARDRTATRAPGRPVNLRLKDNILAAIARVLVEEGYQGLTISRVAKAAGVSTATVYRRWPTKQAMFFDAMRLWRDDLTPQIERAASPVTWMNSSPPVSGFWPPLWAALTEPCWAKPYMTRNSVRSCGK
ncbi:Hypothetical protein GOX0563 [Gluconobacter oxydans 621H]|uniref:HTH tetR-type domain-containing protein n=1 Tax=Gluconobacter oxydans (strain 621H) TaxID=290633 RepID=Q5FTF5_GLUOX|nr:helix-turn-helix domain-containing protein [Gluconobacter oxydans]AAW60341.1 Hypothetical protein GOX0563 [Gluconobacter oxydans 621H]